MGRKKRKANWGKRARDYDDDPKVTGGRERALRHREEHWERVKVKKHKRKNRKKPGSHTVKAHSRQPRHKGDQKIYKGKKGGKYYLKRKPGSKKMRRVYI